MVKKSCSGGLCVLLTALLLAAAAAHSAEEPDNTPYCGDKGIWIQILGGGGPELNDGMASASYLVFVDNKARLLVDPAPGSSASFDKAGGEFADLEAMVFTSLQADHTSDFPAYVAGSYFSNRTRDLPVFGPDGDGIYPDTVSFVDRLIGPRGAFAYLADALTVHSLAGYTVQPRNVSATGREPSGTFAFGPLELTAIPVHEGPIPALAWRVDIGKQSIVFTGDFNNQKNVMPAFAKGADALVIDHSVPNNVRGAAADLHVTPTQIGRIAHQANVRMVILGHRMNRTRGIESLSRQAIEKEYDGSLIFANDLECWGL